MEGGFFCLLLYVDIYLRNAPFCRVDFTCATTKRCRIVEWRDSQSQPNCSCSRNLVGIIFYIKCIYSI